MVVTLAVGGVRFGFRGLRQYLASKRRAEHRVLLYGAGDAGLLALREMRQNPDLGLNPVGFIDDDPLKQGQHVQGVKVVGAGSELERLCQNYDIDLVLITAVRMTDARRMAIWTACQEAGIPCHVFDVRFDAMPAAVRDYQQQLEVVAGDGR
jgi:UDP-GlcNAc:undecaprenyl-phosphate GlcNAc-1-phosphate transferase